MSNFTRLFDILPYQLAKYPQPKALNIREGKNWKSYSTKVALEKIDQVSAALLKLGLKPDDKGAILARGGSPYWSFLDFAMQQIGVVVVPIHASSTPVEIAYMLNETETKICFVENDLLMKKMKTIQKEIPSLSDIFLIQRGFGGQSIEEHVEPINKAQLADIESIRSKIKAENLATIIYTSGTTGEPKGVMLSHNNIVSNIKSVLPLVPINYEKTCLSFLPVSHIFERMVNYSCMAAGSQLYFASSIEGVVDDFKSVRPHYFTTVPSLLEKMYERIEKQASSGNFLKRKLIKWAIRIGKKYDSRQGGSLSYRFQKGWANILVYRGWRRILGGRIEAIMVGAAPLREALLRIYSAAKIPIREGYGLTETSPVLSFNRFEPGGAEFGTVGRPIPGVELKINQPNENGEGEILAKGPNVMMGYFRKEKITAKVLDESGWFRTGDIGKLVNRKFLKITDREKDIFKTSTGKYVAPQKLERRLLSSPFIEQSIVLGYRQSFVAAVIVPYFPVVKNWCEENNVHWTAPQFMVINPKVEALFEMEIDRINQTLEKHERIHKHLLLFEPWTVDSGELTPTLKPKRHVIEERNAKEIGKLYE